VSADAHAALWGGLFDWLVAERSEDRAASPALQYFREGEPIRWRRGARADTVVSVTVTARRAGAVPDTLRLSFAASAALAESPPLAAGVYDVQAEGGASLLVVNESLEMVPRRPVLSAGETGGQPSGGERRGARQIAALFVAVVLMLCAEWILRRRLGLR
jgi:hypothetical protein